MLVVAAVSVKPIFEFVSTKIVFAHKLIIFSDDKAERLATLQSNFHSEWAWRYSSTLRSAGLNYSPSDVFETFPFPRHLAGLESIGERYYAHRQTIMQTRREGLTATYNRFHNPNDRAADIQTLRDLHLEIDRAVAAAYGWKNLQLDHGFHDTKQSIRFTVCEAARRELLDRLLALNHQRHREEVEAAI